MSCKNNLHNCFYCELLNNKQETTTEESTSYITTIPSKDNLMRKITSTVHPHYEALALNKYNELHIGNFLLKTLSFVVIIDFHLVKIYLLKIGI